MKLKPKFIFLVLPIIHYTVGYDDLSRGKPTEQSSPVQLCRGSDCHIEYTVDGNQTTCAHTDDGIPVTWSVDLLESKSIATVWIYYKMPVQKAKVYNYQVFLSNTTRWQDGFLCIDDRGPSFPLPGDVKNCPIIARYVIFKNAVSSGKLTDRTFIFSPICEVKVEGCEKKGVYGSYCDTSCPENCRGELCNAEDGGCFSCRNGWMGPKCQELCRPGWYGEGCSTPCSTHCLNDSCDSSNGTCLFGCKEGWSNMACDQVGYIPVQPQLDDDNLPTSVTIAAILSTLVIVIIIIIIIAVLVRRRNNHQGSRPQTSGQNQPSATSTSKGQASRTPDPHIYEQLRFDNNHIRH